MRQMLVFVAPMLFSNALSSFGPVLSLVWVGRFVSTQALGALVTVSILGTALSALLNAIVSGGSVLAGQTTGANDVPQMRKVAGTVLASAACSGIIVSIVGIFGSGSILSLLGTPKTIVPQTEQFAEILFGASPLTYVYLAYVTLLRSEGDSKTPMYGMALSAILCGLLPPIFIFGWFGLPKLGLMSVAVSVIIANLCALLFIAALAMSSKSVFKPDRGLLRNVGIDPMVLKKILAIGIPMSSQFVFVMLSEVVLLSFVNEFGAKATAAWGTVLQVMSYSQWPATALGGAVSIMGAQYIGARRSDQMTIVVRSGLILNYLIGGAVVFLCYLFCVQLVGWSVTDVQTSKVAHVLLNGMLWSSLIYGNIGVLSGIMRSTGVVLWPMLITFTTIWLVELPVVFLLSRSLGITGVMIGYPTAFCSGLVLMSVYYTFVWKRRQFERLI